MPKNEKTRKEIWVGYKIDPEEPNGIIPSLDEVIEEAMKKSNFVLYRSGYAPEAVRYLLFKEIQDGEE